jgi:hypothetical protein
MMADGWIKIHRSLQQHWIYKDPVKLKWWIDILLTVNYIDAKINIGNELFECKRGQSIMSLQSWADRWKTSKDNARNFLKLLAKDSMILHESIGKSTRITVCNYDSYQNDLHDTQTQTKRKPNANQTQPHPKEEYKEREEEKERKKREYIDKIYSAYPTQCPIRKTSTGKSTKDKEKIKSLLNSIQEDKLLAIINSYVQDCKKNNIYIKNFKTFLNNIPDIDEEILKYDFFSMFPNENLSNNTLNNLENKFNEFDSLHDKKLKEYNLPINIILDLPVNELINYVDTRI